MKIYIIRHGETEWNKVGKLQGQSDIALNDTGRELARRVGIALRDIPFCRAISSPLKRAMETAGLVLEGRNVEIVPEPRIQEISFGIYEGRSIPGKYFPSSEGNSDTDPEFQNFFVAPDKYRAPENGETFERLLARTGAFLEDLAKADYGREDTLLVSTHGAVSRALLLNICQGEIKDFWKQGVPKNCAVSIAETGNGAWKLLKQDVLFYEE